MKWRAIQTKGAAKPAERDSRIRLGQSRHEDLSSCCLSRSERERARKGSPVEFRMLCHNSPTQLLKHTEPAARWTAKKSNATQVWGAKGTPRSRGIGPAVGQVLRGLHALPGRILARAGLPSPRARGKARPQFQSQVACSHSTKVVFAAKQTDRSAQLVQEVAAAGSGAGGKETAKRVQKVAEVTCP